MLSPSVMVPNVAGCGSIRMACAQSLATICVMDMLPVLPDPVPYPAELSATISPPAITAASSCSEATTRRA